MRFALSLAAVVLCGASAPARNLHDGIMDQIERGVQLPKGASPLSAYARYYADGDDGEVVAIYLIPMNYDSRPGDTCEELDTNFNSHEVPCPAMRPSWAMAAGKRRWLEDRRELPFIQDGGCAMVTVIFEKAKSAVKSATCNGEA